MRVTPTRRRLPTVRSTTTAHPGGPDDHHPCGCPAAPAPRPSAAARPSTRCRRATSADGPLRSGSTSRARSRPAGSSSTSAATPSRCDGAELDLSPRQVELLALFLAGPRKVWSREQLHWVCWGDTSPVPARRRAAVPAAGQDRAGPVPQRARPRVGAARRPVAAAVGARSPATVRPCRPRGRAARRRRRRSPVAGRPRRTLRLPHLEADAAGLRRMKRRATGLLGRHARAVRRSARRCPTRRPPGSCRRPPRPASSAGWPTGSPSPRCSATRSACASRTPPSSRARRTSWPPSSASSSPATSSRADAVAGQLAEAQVVPAQRRVARRAGARPARRRRAVDRGRGGARRARRARRSPTRCSSSRGATSTGGPTRRCSGSSSPARSRDRAQQPLVDVCVTRLRAAPRARARHPAAAAQGLPREPEPLLFWLFVTDARVDTLILRAVELLGEVEQDPDHPARRWLDGLLASLADDLRYRPRDRAAGRRLAARAASRTPTCRRCCTRCWSTSRPRCATSLDDLDGGLQVRLTALVGGAARRVLDGRRACRRASRSGCTAAVALRGRALRRRRSSRSSRAPCRGGRRRTPPRASRPPSGATCSSSASTARSSGALAGVVLHTVAVLVG